MVRSRKSATFDHEGFIKGLQSLLDTLPSASQKREIDNAFTELIRFLSDLQKKFQALPSSEDVSHVGQSLLKLEELFASAEKVPVIAAFVEVDRRSTKRNAGARPAKEIEIDVKEVLANLANLPVDEIRSRLGGKSYSAVALRAIASELGARPDVKATKKSLADKIANDIVNRRMFDGLAGRTSPESPVS